MCPIKWSLVYQVNRWTTRPGKTHINKSPTYTNKTPLYLERSTKKKEKKTIACPCQNLSKLSGILALSSITNNALVKAKILSYYTYTEESSTLTPALILYHTLTSKQYYAVSVQESKKIYQHTHGSATHCTLQQQQRRHASEPEPTPERERDPAHKRERARASERPNHY